MKSVAAVPLHETKAALLVARRTTVSEATDKMVGLGRLERPTSPLSGVRSNHLSYRPSTIEQDGFSMSQTASAIALSGEEEKRGRHSSRQWALTEP